MKREIKKSNSELSPESKFVRICLVISFVVGVISAISIGSLFLVAILCFMFCRVTYEYHRQSKTNGGRNG